MKKIYATSRTLRLLSGREDGLRIWDSHFNTFYVCFSKSLPPRAAIIFAPLGKQYWSNDAVVLQVDQYLSGSVSQTRRLTLCRW